MSKPVKLPMSISHFCRLAGAGEGLNFISGGTKDERNQVLTGHLLQAMTEHVPAVALIQDETPDMDRTLMEYARKTNSSIFITNSTTRNFQPFAGWIMPMFTQFAASMMGSDLNLFEYQAYAEIVFRAAGPDVSLSSLLRAVEITESSSFPIRSRLQNLLYRTAQTMGGILPEPGSRAPAYNLFSGLSGNNCLCVFHLSAAQNRDTELLIHYLMTELRTWTGKLWISEITHYNLLQPFLEEKIRVNNLGISSQDAPLILDSWAQNVHREPKLASACVIFSDRVPSHSAELSFLNRDPEHPDITAKDLGLFTRVVYYHGKKSLWNMGQPRIRLSPALYGAGGIRPMGGAGCAERRHINAPPAMLILALLAVNTALVAAVVRSWRAITFPLAAAIIDLSFVFALPASIFITYIFFRLRRRR